MVSNSTTSQVKSSQSTETMEHVLFHCGAMDVARLLLIEKVGACIDDPLDALEYLRLGVADEREQTLVLLGKERKWEMPWDGRMWEELVGKWREFMREFSEGQH